MLKLASSLGFALALAELKERVRRLVTQGVLGLIGVTLFLIGFCFLLVALHLWLSTLLNPIASAAIVGGGLVVIALILFLVAKAKGNPPAPSRAPESPAADTARETVAGLGDLFGSPSSQRTAALAVAGVALFLGFVLGRRARSDD